MAAITSQSAKAVSYIQGFFDRPYLRDYKVSSSQRRLEVEWYERRETGEFLNRAKYLELSDEEQFRYKKYTKYLQVIVGTVAGANSEHVPFFCLDEMDLANPRAYKESKMIPSPDEERHNPVVFLTSTRKTSYGLVQQEIDKHEKDPERSDLQIRHWNIIDVTEKCTPDRHLPDFPRIPIYYSDEYLESISEKQYNGLPPEKQKKYERDEGFVGCLRNCNLFAMCKGRLATKQRGSLPDDLYPPLLKPITHVVNQFKSVDLEEANAQLMCRKPGAYGLIYPYLDAERQKKTAAEIASMVTGEEYSEDFSKQELVALFKSRGTKFVAGMDYGFTHPFAVILFAVDGDRAFVLESISKEGLELEQKIDVCNQQIRDYDPKIYADPEDPASTKTFKRKGFRCVTWKKNAGSVKAGIELTRAMIHPVGMPSRLYFLKGDKAIDTAFERISKYHFATDSEGNLTNKPDEEDDDSCDALRYGLMNTFKKGKGISGPPILEEGRRPVTIDARYTQDDWMQKQIEQLTGVRPGRVITGGVKKKGGFHFGI